MLGCQLGANGFRKAGFSFLRSPAVARFLPDTEPNTLPLGQRR